MDPALILRRLVIELPRYRYSFRTEANLHAGITKVLYAAGLAYQHEHVATPADRFDFLVEGAVVIEAKIGGSLPEAMTQVNRYCALDLVQGVVVVSTSQWARRAPTARMHGKPVHFVDVQRQAF